MKKFSVIVLLAGLFLSLLVDSAQARRAEDEMGSQRAGRYYLKGACLVDRAEKRFTWRVWLGRDSISLREVQHRLPEIKRATRDDFRGVQRWVKHLRTPPAAWPRDVRKPVKRLALDNSRYASLLKRAANARTGRAWGKWWRVAKGYRYHGDAKVIRERLDLPPRRACVST